MPGGIGPQLAQVMEDKNARMSWPPEGGQNSTRQKDATQSRYGQPMGCEFRERKFFSPKFLWPKFFGGAPKERRRRRAEKTVVQEQTLRGQNRNGLSKNTLLDNRFSATTPSPLLWRALIFGNPLGLWTSAPSGHGTHGCPRPNACFSRV